MVEGCRERFRPILMTACTTVFGLIPLALGSSGVFELRYFPLARYGRPDLVYRIDPYRAAHVL